METLGSKIYKLRTDARLSQKELSRKLGVSRQAVSSWETDTLQPRTEKLTILCELFGVSLDYLLSDTSEVAEAVKQSAVSESPISEITNTEITEEKKVRRFSKKKIILIVASVIATALIIFAAVACIGLSLFPQDGDYSVQSVTFNFSAAAKISIAVIAALVLTAINVIFIVRSFKNKKNRGF